MTTETVAETPTHRVRLVLMSDSYSMDPRRDRDGIVTGAATVPDRNYTEVHDPTGTLGDHWAELLRRYDPRDAVRIFTRYVGLCGGVAEYDAPHDGPAVVWYVLPAYMEAVGFTAEQITAERMREALTGERTEWRAWADGDVWGILTEERAQWLRNDPEGAHHGETRETWEEVEAVWGYIGEDYARAEAQDIAAELAEPATV